MGAREGADAGQIGTERPSAQPPRAAEPFEDGGRPW